MQIFFSFPAKKLRKFSRTIEVVSNVTIYKKINEFNVTVRINKRKQVKSGKCLLFPSKRVMSIINLGTTQMRVFLIDFNEGEKGNMRRNH